MSLWVNGTVVERIDWNDKLFTLKVEAEVEPYVAGQFTKLGLEQDGERVQRAYSFVNAPGESLLEFLAVSVEEGKLSPRLQDLRPGDQLMVAKRPTGFMVLDEVPAGRDLWMLATGTAVGPFLSILRDPASWDQFESFNLVYAVRNLEDMAYLEEIRALEQARPEQFKFIPVVSREEVEGMLKGRIPALISGGQIQEYADRPITPSRSQVMVCGNPDMIRDTLAVLEGMKLRKNLRRTPGQITMEKYW
ncbi:ferredoxin--NADP reductase [Ferrimonas sp. YFM]|uniref:ferredoxin--NADP reductase n=1 Tax=Ferrimonas sp. YFM TaxID=3028878 RepID=UPI00257437CC|nr:ferredoxin--NADP reductase [Ferrimonas sp. YFM]BDY03442.1 ferredoxin--NADP(+) reductase [Ferrimonas sp. YFM]